MAFSTRGAWGHSASPASTMAFARCTAAAPSIASDSSVAPARADASARSCSRLSAEWTLATSMTPMAIRATTGPSRANFSAMLPRVS